MRKRHAGKVHVDIGVGHPPHPAAFTADAKHGFSLCVIFDTKVAVLALGLASAAVSGRLPVQVLALLTGHP